MLDFLINALNTKTLTMVFAAVAAVATVLTLAMPLVFADPLGKRMRAVAVEREKIRARERERMAQENQKVSLRQSPKQYIQTIVDRFNLSKWVGQEEARLKLIQAGYRGHAPYITYLFFRMVTPVAAFLFTVFYLFVVLNLDQPVMVKVRGFAAQAGIGQFFQDLVCLSEKAWNGTRRRRDTDRPFGNNRMGQAARKFLR